MLGRSVLTGVGVESLAAGERLVTIGAALESRAGVRIYGEWRVASHCGEWRVIVASGE